MRVPSSFEALWYPHLYFDVTMDNILDQSTIQHKIFGDQSKCHVVIVPHLFGVGVEILLLPAFFRENHTATYSLH